MQGFTVIDLVILIVYMAAVLFQTRRSRNPWSLPDEGIDNNIVLPLSSLI